MSWFGTVMVLMRRIEVYSIGTGMMDRLFYINENATRGGKCE